MLDQDFKLASIIHKGFTQHKELNPQIFDEEQRIRPEVREKLILAANDFIDTLNIDNIDFEDIVIVGSIVNYNWNPYSDVDLHIIFDFKEIDENIELVSEFFMAKKSLWNQDHDVKIYEYDVELYGQDINEENASGGIYSLMKNEWVKKPEPEQYEVSESSLIKKTKYFIKLLNDVLELDATDETKIKKLKAIKEKIRKYRKSGLETGGEYSEENLTFKMLRRSGYLEKLSDIKNDLEDKMMSLSEGLMLPYKKIKYYDLNTGEEFPKSEINEHPQWYKYEYDTNGKNTYSENSNGEWIKHEYDQHGNEIYREDSDGYWSKREYDQWGNNTYYENSDGYWLKYEYDKNGNEIYRENSYGVIIDRRNQIQEGLMLRYKKIKYFDVDTDKEFPKQDIDKHPRWYMAEYNDTGKIIYREYYNGFLVKYEYDQWGHRIYYEDNVGLWEKAEYDNNGNKIYQETSTGYWVRWEYDDNGNVTYKETSDMGVVIDYRNQIQEGLMLPYKKFPDRYFDDITNKEFPKNEINEHPDWHKQEYDQYGNVKYYEESNGYWAKYEYDTDGNRIYYEDINGRWYKQEYDNNGNLIYLEDNWDGVIIDNRNQIQEGLMLGYKKFPDQYFDSNTHKEFPKSEINEHPRWYKFEYDKNENIIYKEESDGFWAKFEYTKDGKISYYEDSDGYWEKREYDNNGNEIYYEDYNGYWEKREYDINGNEIYYENRNGEIVDNRDRIQEGLMLQYKDLSTPELWFKDLVNQMEIYEENLVGIDKVITFYINGVPYMEYYDFSNLFNYCYDYIDSVLENKFGMDVNKVHAFLQDMIKKYYNIDLQTARMNVVFYNRT